MKRLLLISLIIFSLLAFSFQKVNGEGGGAPIVPYTIAGKVALQDGRCVSGFDIKIKTFSPSSTSIDKILEQQVSIDDNCEYAVVLGNEPYSLWYSGMKIDLTFCDVSKNPLCAKTLTIGQNPCGPGGGCRLDYSYGVDDLTNGGQPIIQYVNSFICPDGSKVDDASKCPIVTPPPARIICKDGTEVTNVNDCLETKEQVKNYGLIYGVVIGGAFASLVAYWIKKKRTRGKKTVDTYIEKRKK